jgi:hypothetical protein
VRTASGEDQRTGLTTLGIPTSAIPGLLTCETRDLQSPEFMREWASMSKDMYPRAEVFGEYCTCHIHIDCPIEMAYEYISNVHSLEEYTASTRSFAHLGGGIYKGEDRLARNTPLYMQVKCFPDSRCVDYLCAWDQGRELWMRYHFRLLDASQVFAKPGCVLIWTNCKHPYYDRASPAPDYVDVHRKRTDRPWVGDLWPHFYEGHLIESRNLKAILEYRFTHGPKHDRR